MSVARDIFLGLLVAVLCSAPDLAGAGSEAYSPTRFDDPPPDGCLPNDCSLREAVMASAEDDAYDSIQLSAGTYDVSSPPLALAGGVRVYGAGIDATMIVGDGSDSLFTYASPQQMSLEALTIDAGGQAELTAVASDTIGLFRVRAPNPAGRIEITGEDGGGFGVGQSEILASVRCEDVDYCLFYDSTLVRIAKPGGPFGGGGTEVILENVIIDGSLAPGADSGLFVDSTADVSISDAAIQHTNLGASLTDSPFASFGDVNIVRLRYLDNARPLSVGYRDQFVIRDSEFRDNHDDDLADPRPGALWIQREWTQAQIDRTSFIGNRGSSDAGGALLVEGGANVAIRNSTFSDNTFGVEAASQPGGVRGAAIGFRDSSETTTLTLQHVTIVAPTPLPVGVTGTALGGYGGEDGLAIVVLNSILRGSCRLETDAMDIPIGNIESEGDTCDFASDISNQVGVAESALALGTLGDHGGHTPTYLPSSSSVAVGSAHPDYCLEIDQRGYPRPLVDGCDVGAVEAGDVIFADTFE